MKDERRMMKILIIIHIATVLAGTVLWLVKVGNGKTDIVVLLGAGLGMMSGVCFSALVVLHRKWREREQQEQERKQIQMEQAHKQQLQEVREAKQTEMENFRSTMVHSLRMPVAIIQGYTELLAGDMVKDPRVRKEYMEKIIQRSQYMSELMSRSFTVDEKLNREKLSYSKIDLLTLVSHIITDMHKVAKEKGTTIQIVSTEDVLIIEADEYLLNRVIFNLLENALKYMGRPGVVTIRIQKKEEWVSIRVQDDGIGLSPEETAHIFENRFQGSNRLEGSGCGLYLVKKTVEAHGGEIYAQSDLGKGMGIIMKFPLKRPEEV